MEDNRDMIRQVIREETAHLTTQKDLQDVESTLNEKMDAMLTKMDVFVTGLGRESQERVSADAQLDRRVAKLEATS